MPFSPIRTGDANLDRIQQRIRDTQEALAQGTANVAAGVPVIRRGLTIRVSQILPADVASALVTDTLGDIKIVLPDAKPLSGLAIAVNNSGSFNVTLIPGNVSGRRQAINGAANYVISTGNSVTISSTGTDWNVT